MSNHSYSFKLFILMILVLVFPMISFGQASPQTSTKSQVKTQQTFSQRINRSNQDLKRSKIYYLSYKKNHEISYLSLSAAQCTSAIKTLKATQAMFPNTTPFYYKAKNKRFTACQFFDKLQDTASRLDPRYHIKDIADDGCNF